MDDSGLDELIPADSGSDEWSSCLSCDAGHESLILT